MSRKRLFYFIFFAVLTIGFFVVLALVIPGFSKPQMPPISYVRPFTFTNQDGNVVTEKDMSGKVAAVEYFFTTCKGICPRLNNNLKTVYQQFKGEKDFLILSHTSDPEVDSVQKLKRYADSMQVDTDRWQFVTGRKDSLYLMARQSYKIDDPANNLQRIEDDFLHTQFIAVVNKKGDVVKIYDGLKKSEMTEMAKTIEKLLKD
ncbi:MAG TPA: SCO family protein [Chitinophagaceae bacterium]|nr:SCO family protein [Chitinophagaceae bacterium]